MELFESPALTTWGWMKSEVYIRRRIHETNCSLAFWMLLSAYRNANNNSDENHAILAHEFRSSLRLTVGFSNIYCVM